MGWLFTRNKHRAERGIASGYRYATTGVEAVVVMRVVNQEHDVLKLRCKRRCGTIHDVTTCTQWQHDHIKRRTCAWAL